jgi:signal transduction histidine kinase
LAQSMPLSKRSWTAVLGPLVVPVLVWAVVLAVQRRGVPREDLRLDNLRLVETDASAPAAARVANAGPHWHKRGVEGPPDFTLEHHFAGPGASDQEPLALYVPSVERNVEVFLNGTKVGDGGRILSPVERNRHRPLFFTIPSGLVRPGENALRIRVVSEWWDPAFIPAAYFGPRDELDTPYRWQYAFKVTSMQVMIATILLLELFIGGLWLHRRRETVYAWFAAGLLFWAVYNVNYAFSGWPVTDPRWPAVHHCALGAFLYCMILFVHRLVDMRPVRLERLLTWVTVLASGALLLGTRAMSPDRLWDLINTWYRVIPLALGAALLARLTLLARRERTGVLYWLGSVTLVTFSFGIHDSLRQVGWIDPTVPNLMQYAALAALLVFGYMLVDRFAGALRHTEELNLALDHKVHEKTRALAEQYERTRALEREMVLAEERERLMRDMHDGMGGQLVSLLSLVRSGAGDPRLLEQAVTECLSDLRLMIDSMDTAGEDLAVGLGSFRARVEPRLRAIGLKVRWDTQAVPEGLRLGPEGVLHAFRILQEAIQNAIKHAQATTLRVEARADGAPGSVEVSVTDDGVGIPALPVQGRGLRNMQRRAAQIGGVLTVAAADPGTRVTLTIPAARTARVLPYPRPARPGKEGAA